MSITTSLTTIKQPIADLNTLLHILEDYDPLEIKEAICILQDILDKKEGAVKNTAYGICYQLYGSLKYRALPEIFYLWEGRDKEYDDEEHDYEYDNIIYNNSFPLGDYGEMYINGEERNLWVGIKGVKRMELVAWLLRQLTVVLEHRIS